MLDRSFLPGDTRDHGPADRRRPRPVRDPLARPHARRHDRHPGRGHRAVEPRAARGRSTSSSTRRRATSSTPPTRGDVLSIFAGSARWSARGATRSTRPALARARRRRLAARAWSRSPAASGRPTAGWPRTPSTTRREVGGLPRGRRHGRISGSTATTTAPSGAATSPSTARMRPTWPDLAESVRTGRPLHPALPYRPPRSSGPPATRRPTVSGTSSPARTRALFLDARASARGPPRSRRPSSPPNGAATPPGRTSRSLGFASWRPAISRRTRDAHRRMRARRHHGFAALRIVSLARSTRAGRR